MEKKRDTTPRKDWDAIRYDYLDGMPVREISKKHKIDYTQISKQAKKKGWGEHNQNGKILNKMIDDIRYNTDIDQIIDKSEDYKVLQQSLNITMGSESDNMIRRMLIKKMILQNRAFNTAIRSYDAVDSYTDKLMKNIENSADGLYTKSIGQGGSVTYASYADDIAKVAVPMISEANKLLKEENTQIAIQNNINTDDKKIVINVKAKKKDAD